MVHVRGSAHYNALDAGTPRPDTCVRRQRLFRGQESELRHLRRWLTGLFPDCPERDDLISVAVELGTNAVQHTASGDGGWFTVEVTHKTAVVRLDVTDEGGPRGPRIGGDPDGATAAADWSSCVRSPRAVVPAVTARPDRLGRDRVVLGRAGTRRAAGVERRPSPRWLGHAAAFRGQCFLTGQGQSVSSPGGRRGARGARG